MLRKFRNCAWCLPGITVAPSVVDSSQRIPAAKLAATEKPPWACAEQGTASRVYRPWVDDASVAEGPSRE